MTQVTTRQIPPLDRWVWLIAATVSAILLAVAGRYGYHRDELYFLLCGQHLDWGYVDQPPLTPAIARLAETIAPGNLTVLRTPSALIAGACVVLVALTAREVGGGRGAQLLAAALVATSSAAFAFGHLLSTTTIDVVIWLVIIWLFVRVLRTGDTRWALLIGAVTGLGLLNKYLVGLLVIGLVGGLLIAGPRRLLRDRWVLAGGAIALLLFAPNLAWQIANGFPQLDVAGEIASGDSSYAGRPVALALQLVIVSWVATVVWISGLVALFRRPEWRPYRALAWAWVVVVVLVLLGGGKGYYDAALLLALTGVGAVPLGGWLSRGRVVLRRVVFASAVVFCAVSDAVLMLPLWPASSLPDAVVAINYDAGETIGWPAMVASVERVTPPGAVVLTSNYGEAGAIARYGTVPVYSGHMSVADFGTPPESADVVVAVGIEDPAYLRRFFGSVERVGSVDVGVDVDNEENGAPLYLCRDPVDSWASLWPALRRV
ncbi:glycosyltransferase family 39 protein [Cryptosporangium aurantiacum]|uniref:Dolichyl-phosphate-mannose-protein mannosyltransferase n=1 Tax=Cryptosporangium aurantiacum TaxID=134849 RepID=A0A1M7RLE3_9ACTN|nr:glycosyltransferase family 39 protein [Cryptosporangium aurantiacum]SHN46888.1 Dolichyl-phosphate-mannose-protein mannosyltransferase [Cryptosporangium aurantiacum]